MAAPRGPPNMDHLISDVSAAEDRIVCNTASMQIDAESAEGAASHNEIATRCASPYRLQATAGDPVSPASPPQPCWRQFIDKRMRN